jgi:membrane protein DedA with SNARE-associated domain
MNPLAIPNFGNRARRLAGAHRTAIALAILAAAALATVVGLDRLGLATSTWDAPVAWLQAVSDRLLETALAYGYAGLGLLLFVGTLGLPVPSGLAAGLAGSLIAEGSLDWKATIATAMLATTLGDLLGYAVGRLIGIERVGQLGRRLGLTRDRLARATPFVDRWGWSGLLVSRTIASALGPAVNLVAGTNRMSLAAFLACELVGRGAWSAAYLTLGYSLS